MTSGTEQDLMRLLHGELPPAEARELRERMRSEPALAEEYRRLERTWSALALPPAAPVPAGFAGRVMAHARGQAAPARLSWNSAPGWVRAAAAAALVAGAALGIEAGRSWPAAEAVPDSPATVSSLAGPEYNLAEGYWDVVDDATALHTGGEIQR